MNSKFKKLISGFLILAELAFLILVIPIKPAKAQILPEPGVLHTMTATVTDSVGTITDQSNVIGAEGSWKLTAVAWTNGANIQRAMGDVEGTDSLIYQFDGLTTTAAPYYFVVETGQMKGAGIVKFNLSTKKYEMLSTLSATAAQAILAATSPPLSDAQTLYLMSFCRGDGGVSRYDITNLTNSTIAPTGTSINCPDYPAGTVEYTAETSDPALYKFSDEDKVRVTKGLPPVNSNVRMYYMPIGSPGIYLSKPVEKKTMNAGTNTFKLDYPNMKPGWYLLESDFGVEVIDNGTTGVAPTAKLSPSLTDAGNEGFSSWITRLWDAKQSDIQLGGLVGGLIGPAGSLVGMTKAISRGAAGARYEGYSGFTYIQVGINGEINLVDRDGTVTPWPTTPFCPPVFNFTRDTSIDMTVGNQKGVCDVEGNFITAMIGSAFCGLVINMKTWADTVYCWALGLFESSVGVSTGGTVSSGGLKKATICTPDTSAGVKALEGTPAR